MSTMAPLGRSGEPTDIASVVVDLAASAYITGDVVVVDGGFTLTT
jgi:NAD(P)-dependent dehydrogenase (short-subunit alcohol dehydrogenase family)